MYCVYVLDKEGKPLMPTTRFGKVRRMLRSGKAVIARHKPFTVRLNYEPETRATQEVTLGIDPGRTNIGLAAVRADGKCLFAAECVTRNKEIPELMAKRKSHRMASRRGERLRRKRRAKKRGTLLSMGQLKRKLPGYGKGRVTVKDIINTEARFNNRVRPAGWLTPTATQLVRTHVALLKLARSILPVSGAAVELNRFAFMQLDDPDIHGIGYQHGPLHGYASVNDAADDLQGGKCLLCGGAIEHHHHIVPVSRRGSDTIRNIAGLCGACHGEIHKDPHGEKAKALVEAKEGLDKRYGGTSVLNQAMPRILREFSATLPGHVHVTRGWDTKQFREANRVGKTHAEDAYCVACIALGCPPSDAPGEGAACQILQFRRHNRALTKRESGRLYYNGKKLVAKSRRPACSNDTESADGKKEKKGPPALSQWRGEMARLYGESAARAMVSRLKVQRGQRIRYKDMGRPLPGAEYLYHGKRYVLKGNYKSYVYPLSGMQDKVPAKDVKIISSKGLVFV